MKPEEVIQILCKKSLYDSPKEIKAKSIAEKALKKATAKMPNVEGDGYYNGVLIYDTWICPDCETRYELDYDEHKYCPECGQKIDLDRLRKEYC